MTDGSEAWNDVKPLAYDRSNRLPTEWEKENNRWHVIMQKRYSWGDGDFAEFVDQFSVVSVLIGAMLVSAYIIFVLLSDLYVLYECSGAAIHGESYMSCLFRLSPHPKEVITVTRQLITFLVVLWGFSNLLSMIINKVLNNGKQIKLNLLVVFRFLFDSIVYILSFCITIFGLLFTIVFRKRR